MGKYDDTSKPETLLADYQVVISIGGSNEYVSMRSLPLMLQGLAWAWLNGLPMDSIYEWEDLEQAFLKNFQGMYNRPGSFQDLQMCVQRDGEPVYAYIQCQTQIQNFIENVPEDQAINAFQQGLRYKLLGTSQPGATSPPWAG